MSSPSIIIRLIYALKLLAMKIAVWRFSFLLPRRGHLKRVLLLRPDNLGDFLITLSSFQHLCDEYHSKGYEISILVAPKNELLAQNCQLFDHVLTYDICRQDFSWKKRIQMFRELYSRRFEVVINPLMLPGQCVLSHFISVLCRPAVSIAAVNRHIATANLQPLQAYLWIDRWKLHYTHFLEMNAPSLMESEHILAEQLCNSQAPIELYSRGFGAALPFTAPSPYYILVPGTISHTPWPMKNVVQLMSRIHSIRPDLTVVLTGAPNEKHYGEEIRHALPADFPLVDKIGESSLLSLFEGLKNAQFVVTNDTGTAHLAPLADTPTIVLLGGGHPNAYLPNKLYTKMHCITHHMQCFNCGWKCDHKIDGINQCIYDISVEDVLDALKDLL